MVAEGVFVVKEDGQLSAVDEDALAGIAQEETPDTAVDATFVAEANLGLDKVPSVADTPPVLDSMSPVTGASEDAEVIGTRPCIDTTDRLNGQLGALSINSEAVSGLEARTENREVIVPVQHATSEDVEDTEDVEPADGKAGKKRKRAQQQQQQQAAAAGRLSSGC